MALPATDSFTQGGAGFGPLSASWTVTTGMGTPQVQQTADVVEVSSVGADAAAYWNADAFNNDQYAQIKVVTAAGTDRFVGCAVRTASGAQTFYQGGVFGALGGSVTTRIRKTVAGVNTTLGATGTATVNTGDTIKLEVSGTTITLYLNGVSVLSRTDSSIASGSAGIFLFTDSGGVGDAELDDFLADNLVAAAAQVPYQPAYLMAPVMAQ